ncbi:V-type ATP synthase subunit D [Arthrobacter sp. zg-Y1143]|uniref:V-type ATP synthase subunit D n=1 Tax=Arthrobacter sp. zg-Y1143 TaxID=3049065 RepID=UPI0024C2E997|nr:V-type ATP synthase subunit D [Arthrobacter sp. zg-Y1143]MDK1327497.1 V-type ATP synthase subunit D [Arthrobacter sp. zg-Y1143]
MSGFRSGGSRAERAEVQRRLATARRGAELLDRKQRILQRSIDGLAERADAARLAWEELAREAAVWLRRTTALDGADRLAEAAPSDTALATVRWGGAMGISYPEDASCTVPAAPPAGGTSALAYAAAAHRTALEAAVAAAASQRALLLVSEELAATRTRQRAVENRWIPRLEEQLTAIERRIAEQELEESLRLRWAAGLM